MGTSHLSPVKGRSDQPPDPGTEKCPAEAMSSDTPPGTLAQAGAPCPVRGPSGHLPSLPTVAVWGRVGPPRMLSLWGSCPPSLGCSHTHLLLAFVIRVARCRWHQTGGGTAPASRAGINHYHWGVFMRCWWAEGSGRERPGETAEVGSLSGTRCLVALTPAVLMLFLGKSETRGAPHFFSIIL